MSVKRPPVEVAADILKEKFPGAQLAFVGGSFNRGEATAYSDIDLVAVFEHLENGWRESFTFDGWPVEAFVHDPETLAAFFDSDVKSGTPCLLTMVLEGPAIPADHPLAAELKAKAKTMLDTGPPAWDQATLDSARYSITDVIDDLRAPRNDIEAAALIGALHEKLGDFYFRSRRLWSAERKQIPRKLALADPVLATRWGEVFLAAWDRTREPLFALAEQVLQPYGGLLFDGYRSDAPKDKHLGLETGFPIDKLIE